MFQAVEGEIAERTAFMEHMQKCQRRPEEYMHVRLEVATRLRDLQRLDRLISNEQRACPS